MGQMKPKKVEYRYLQLELCPFTYYRQLPDVKEVISWYEHLVLNKSRVPPYKLVAKSPVPSIKRPEYCIIDLHTGCYVSEKELKTLIKEEK